MKTVLKLLCLTMLIASCKQKNDFTTTEPNNFSIKHCHNNMQDTNELGIDCGWACKPCKEINPVCTPTINTINVSNSSFATEVGDFLVIDNKCVMKSTNGNTFYIQFPTNKPSKYIAYNIVIQSNANYLNPNEVYVTINLSGVTGNNTSLTEGTLYFMEIKGTYYATICNAEAGFSKVIGKFTCN